MKFNLKNRPTIEDYWKSEGQYFDEWFEGFEKELKNRIYPKWQRTEGAIWINYLIKEILGE